MTTLDLRTLNRTFLLRQHLLRRTNVKVPALIEHLVGLQAQEPIDPYITLWSRIDGFDPMTLSDLLERRRVVRASLMRSTIHLVTARDCLAFRPLVQSRLERSFYGQAWRHAVASLDAQAVLGAGREILDAGPVTTKDLRQEMGARFPDADAEALALMVKYIVPAVQVPPRGLWGRTAYPAWAGLETFLGRPMREPEPGPFLLRYLAAFGPATLADFRNWSGLTGYNDVVDRLRPKLRTFRDEHGRELLDVLDAPIAEASEIAPPRFFATYDNVFLGHSDRARIVDGSPFKPDTLGTSTLSVDGFLCGTWRLTKRKRSATLSIEPRRTLTKHERSDVAQEAERLMDLLVPQIAERDLRFV